MTLKSVNYIYLEACNKPNRLSITIFFSSLPLTLLLLFFLMFRRGFYLFERPEPVPIPRDPNSGTRGMVYHPLTTARSVKRNDKC